MRYHPPRCTGSLALVCLASLVGPPASARERWTVEEARAWYDQLPWLVGCNFIPSTAINQLEMWQADTFDPATSERELGWAAQTGMNTVRVYLHDLVWDDDRDGFLKRIDRFLELAHGADIRVLLVMFDGVWDPHPKLGPQRPPRPHVHNSGWVQSPGAPILGDVARHDALEGYVRGIVGHFRADDRILAWDLFNEPDNPNPAYAEEEIPEKAERARQLLEKAFVWARAENPTQPLTAGVWRGQYGDPESLSAIHRLMLEESDIVTFHSYGPPERVGQTVEELKAYGRPMICTEYLARGLGNTFEKVLPIFKANRVGAIHWGLVAGKTQTQYPWTSWRQTFEAEPEVWHHDVYRPNGTPYRAEEVELLRRLTQQGPDEPR